MQHIETNISVTTSLPTYVDTLPQKLKDIGYSTYMIGQWNLGHSSKDYLPINRGFDYFFGKYWLCIFDYLYKIWKISVCTAFPLDNEQTLCLQSRELITYIKVTRVIVQRSRTWSENLYLSTLCTFAYQGVSVSNQRVVTNWLW